jgi:sugar lactone lactonase YvrE
MSIQSLSRRRDSWRIHLKCTPLIGLVLCAMAAHPANGSSDVTIGDTLVFPESITALSDGTVFTGSKAKPVIYRAPAGSGRAMPWIHLKDVYAGTLGVLAEPRTGTLWACALDPPSTAPMTQKHTALLSFDLASGEARASYPLPGEVNLCNDIAVSRDGAIYVSDTFNGRIYRLRKGGALLELWLSDPILVGVDGLTFVGSRLYVDTITTLHIFRIPIGADGAAGTPVDIALSQPLGRPDGLRAEGKRLFVAENGAGRVSELRLDGDRATVVHLREGLSTPTEVEPHGHVLWVCESKLPYFNDPKLRGQDPGAFTVYALPLR